MSEIEAVHLKSLPPEARHTGDEPFECGVCGEDYPLPLYEMPDGPVVTIAKCPACGSRQDQMPKNRLMGVN